MTAASPQHVAGPQSRQAQPTNPIVACHDLDVSLGQTPVLHQVNLRLDPAETLALLGGNGSGKTTLLRALLGLVPAGGGECELFGTPVGRFRDWARLGYVPQRGQLQVPTASVAEIVASGRLARRGLLGLPSAEDRAAVAEALAVVNLTGLERAGVTRLSGGQRQRVLIARALATGPDLIVLDEPLAGLDLPTQHGLAEVLTRLKRAGTTILVVLHELGPLADLIDRSVVLRQGRVIYDGVLAGEHGPGAGGGHLHPEDSDQVAGLAVPLNLGGIR